MKISSNKLEMAMANKCMTVTNIAKLSGLGRQVITAIVRGRRNPKPATIGKIAKAMGVNVVEIIEETGGHNRVK